MYDFSHPVFDPLWRRLLVSGFLLGWAVFEFTSGGIFWGLLFAAFGAWSVWSFFVVPRGKDADKSEADQ